MAARPCALAIALVTPAGQAFTLEDHARAFPRVSYLRKRLSQLVGLSGFFLATM
jgi:hypothetical protein